MVKEIDGLKVPASVECKAELQNRDTNRRAVSGRLITKLAPNEKWKVTVSYSTVALSIEYQKKFYEKCMELRARAGTLRFLSPYDGEEKEITVKCVGKTAPELACYGRGKPTIFKKVGAVFEEV